MNGEKFNSDRAPEAVGLYPHARKVGNLLFLSGVGPRKVGQPDIPGVTLDKNGNISDYDIEVQCHAVFENIRFILEDTGSSWEKIVDVQVFLTNMKDDFNIKMNTKIIFQNQKVTHKGVTHNATSAKKDTRLNIRKGSREHSKDIRTVD